MIDSHCHLQLLFSKVPRDLVLSRARSIGISAIITCACSVSDWTNSSDLTITPQIFQQYGIHPWWAKEERPADYIETLRSILLSNPRSGVGEIGIDKNKKSTIPLDIQIDTFLPQLRLAQELDRPTTIHCVNAYGLLVDLLKDNVHSSKTIEHRPPIVIHSFSGSGEVVEQLVKLFPSQIFFSVSGQCPRESVIPFIPHDKLLIETDSPDQPMTNLTSEKVPEPIDPKINDPSQLMHVATRVATAIGKDVDYVIEITTRNARRAFKLD